MSTLSLNKPNTTKKTHPEKPQSGPVSAAEHFTRNTEPADIESGNTQADLGEWVQVNGAADRDRAFPPRPKLSMIEHGRISPSPLNPRKHFDEISLRDLADSILTYGIQQPIVVRQHVENLGTAGGVVTYTIVMGERRWRAAALAGLATVPALVRTDLDDLKHAVLAMEENVRRRDLSPIEEANGYAQLMALGKTQAQIGEGVGVGQSRIANLLRLRGLPQDVQQMIEAGTLSTGHGIQLARYKDFPDVCRFIAAKAADGQRSVKSLEDQLLSSFYIAPGRQPFEMLGGYRGAKFEWQTICPACPFGAYWAKGQSQPLCLNPAHFEALNKEATAETDAEANREAARLLFVAEQRSAEAQKRMGQAETKSEKADALAERDIAEAVRDTLVHGLPRTEYGKVTSISARDCPAECVAGSCPCAIQARDQYDNAIVPACSNPKRQEGLKLAEAKVKNKERRIIFDDLRRQLSEVSWNRDLGETKAQRALALIAAHFLRNCKKDARKDVAARLPEKYADVRRLLERTGFEVPEAEAHSALARMTMTEMLCLAAEIYLRDELISRYDYGHGDAPNTTWFLSPIATDSPIATEVSEAEAAPLEISRLFPCTDCHVKDAGAFYVDGNGCEMDKGSPGGEWICLTCQGKRQAECGDETLFCDQCRESLTAGAFGEADLSLAAGGTFLRVSSGELAVSGRTFCDQCGPTRRDDGSPKLGHPFPASDDVALLDDCEPLTDNESPLCGCGEPTCMGTCPVPEDAWEYAAPESQTPEEIDAKFCGSCGVIPVSGNAKYCPDCETPEQARRRSAAAKEFTYAP